MWFKQVERDPEPEVVDIERPDHHSSRQSLLSLLLFSPWPKWSGRFPVKVREERSTKQQSWGRITSTNKHLRQTNNKIEVVITISLSCVLPTFFSYISVCEVERDSMLWHSTSEMSKCEKCMSFSQWHAILLECMTKKTIVILFTWSIFLNIFLFCLYFFFMV